MENITYKATIITKVDKTTISFYQDILKIVFTLILVSTAYTIGCTLPFYPPVFASVALVCSHLQSAESNNKKLGVL